MSLWSDKCLERIAVALENIAAHLEYANERTFPPVKQSKTEGKPVPAVFSRKKREDAT